MQLKAQSLKRRLVQAIVLRGYLLCLLEVLQRMGKTPRIEVKTHRPSPQKKATLSHGQRPVQPGQEDYFVISLLLRYGGESGRGGSKTLRWSQRREKQRQ